MTMESLLAAGAYCSLAGFQMALPVGRLKLTQPESAKRRRSGVVVWRSIAVERYPHIPVRSFAMLDIMSEIFPGTGGGI